MKYIPFLDFIDMWLQLPRRIELTTKRVNGTYRFYLSGGGRNYVLDPAAILGAAKTPKKAKASRINGGKPKKQKVLAIAKQQPSRKPLDRILAKHKKANEKHPPSPKASKALVKAATVVRIKASGACTRKTPSRMKPFEPAVGKLVDRLALEEILS